MSGKILITRPAEQAREFARVLESMGYRTLVDPLLTIKPLPFTLKNPANDYKALILSSTHAVSPAAHTGVQFDIPLYVVGETTKEAAWAAGFTNIVSAPDAATLCETMQDNGPTLYLRGKDIAFPLSKNLHLCDETIVYEAIPASSFSKDCLQAFAANEIEAVTLFSARTAEIFCKLYVQANQKILPTDIKVLCFGNSVLECVRPVEFKQTYGSAEPTRESMISLIRTHCPLDV